MPPFLKKLRNKTLLKLNKELYPSDLIAKIKKLDPSAILCARQSKGYFLLELNTSDKEDYFDFLNYLIFHKIDS